jgi:hypothetical protein
LKEAGDVAAARGRVKDGEARYTKGLHLLLDILGQSDPLEWPEFVPKVEAFLLALQGAPLSMRTVAMLMFHFERIGEFGKAEDRLFSMLESDPDNAGVVEFGIRFYQRLLARSDEELAAGNLPRAEVESGMDDLKHRLDRGSQPAPGT